MKPEACTNQSKKHAKKTTRKITEKPKIQEFLGKKRSSSRIPPEEPQMAPKGLPKEPKWTPRIPLGVENGVQIDPRGTK